MKIRNKTRKYLFHLCGMMEIYKMQLEFVGINFLQQNMNLITKDSN